MVGSVSSSGHLIGRHSSALAELTAILPGHPDRISPLLGKARVIDDPHFDRPATLDRRQHKLAHPGQHRSLRPRCVPHKIKQGLMLRGNLPHGSSPWAEGPRCGHCRHRFDTLALDSPSTNPGSNRASAPVDRHRPAPRRAPRYRPQIALHSPSVKPRPFRSPDPEKIDQNTTSWGR